MLMRTASMIAALSVIAACEPSGQNAGANDAHSAGVAPAGAPTMGSASDSLPGARLRTELERLVGGLSTRADPDTIHSWFSAETADVLSSAAVDSIGHATVDFHDLRNVIPNASSSAGSALLLQELNSAVFRVAGIRSVEYRMNGSCDVFWEWLQYSCHTVTR
jgi:hypothetical protein